MKETLRRALRTFVQAAVGYVVAHAAITAGGVADGSESLKSAIITLVAASVACGLAAVMNLPKKTQTDDTEGGKSKEDGEGDG